MKANRIAATLLALSLIPAALPAAEEVQLEKEPAAEERSFWEKVETLYEKAKEAGEEVPSSVYQWAKEDLQAIGDVEYRIFTIPGGSSDEKLTETMNELGRERWDCFWVEPRGGGHRLWLKRGTRSYLKAIPYSDLMKMVPTGDGGSGE
jgi:hypothetical protein